MAKKKIYYLDNAATTPVDGRVLKKMGPFLKESFGNASSLHLVGLEAREAVDEAVRIVADFLGCGLNEVYFTSGATESNNLAILGLARGLAKKSSFKPHLITTRIEHDSILGPFKFLEKEGFEVTYLPVNQQGLVSIKDLKKAVKENTGLISIMYANNEVGTIQPVKEIGQVVKDLNKNRKHKILFHIDAVQAAGYFDLTVDVLGVDALSFSGHKIYGPKGIGVFYLRRQTAFEPIMFGGHQQGSIRPGTFPVSLIVGLGEAVKIISDKKEKEKEVKKISKLRDYLVVQLNKRIERMRYNGDLKSRLPGNAHFIFEGVEGESVLLMLSQKGLAVSTGSACSSGSLDPSHVLMAMGIKPELAHGSLRVTLGRFTEKTEIDHLIKSLPPVIKKLRGMSPLK